MNATKAELSRLQERIAEGRAPELPAGKDSEFYWHPHITGFALRLYANGTGSWWIQYRNQRGMSRKHRIGDAAVLTLSIATLAAKRKFGDIANGIDPQGKRKEALDKPKCTFAAMAELMFEARRIDGPDPLSPKTLELYRSMLKNHVGKLATMQMDEITRKHVADKLTEAAKISEYVRQHTRAFISVVFKWGNQEGLIECPNPVDGTRKSEKLPPRDRPLSLDEIGAVWRACETMAAEPQRYRGNARGAQAPTGATSILADSLFLSVPEAVRHSGLSTMTLHRALGVTGEKPQLKASRRRDLPVNHTANDPLKITQGKGHKRDFVIKVADLNHFLAGRSGLMRSPGAEYAAIIRLLLLLGGRLDEMLMLHWDEIIEEKGKDGAVVKYLRIKGKRTKELGFRRGTKNKDDLKLPLPQMALDILAEFPRRPGNPRVFGDKGTKGMGTDPAQKRLNALITKNEGKALDPPWRAHDLRHTITTNMNEMGLAPPWIVEQITNHRSGHKQGIAGRYNHAKYNVPIDVALQRWARVIRNVADGADPFTNVFDVESNVLSFFERRKEAS